MSYPEYYKKENISETCERCGNDSTGALVHLPASKKYIALCFFCYWGLGVAMYKQMVAYLNDNNLTQAERDVIEKKISKAIDYD